MPIQQLNVTDLDFDAIKANLKNYFRRPDSPFKDWDFEGSGLSQLLDVLAYNTHYNALLAHMSVNESFLESAQIRANVVSGVKKLGYVPGSTTAPRAEVTLVFTAKTGVGFDTFLQIPRGTKFKSQIDGKTYSFFTTETLSAPLNSGNKTFTFENVKIAQGAIRTRRHLVNGVNSSQKFVIEDANADVNDLQVNVFANALTTEKETYTRWTNFDGITGTSPIYFLEENHSGKYEVSFGNNVFGKRPGNTSVVELSYAVTNGPDANGCSIFSYADTQFANVVGVPRVSTISPAAGGSERESAESIRFNAPLSLIAQNRAVTAEDYKAIIRKEFSGIDTINVWGGETEPIPQYGKVFISIKPSGDTEFLTQQQKSQILAILQTKKVLTVTPELVDPEYTYVRFDVFFKFNPNKTTLTQGSLQEGVRNAIIAFNNDYLQSFDGSFRYSEFLKSIVASNAAILNALSRVYVYKKLNLVTVNPSSNTVYFGMPLDGTITQDAPIISSTAWSQNGTLVYLRDEKLPGSNANSRRLFTYTPGPGNTIVKVNSDVGRLYVTDGRLELTPIPVDANTTIEIHTQAASDDISPKRNQLLKIDSTQTSVFSEVDASSATTFTRD